MTKLRKDAVSVLNEVVFDGDNPVRMSEARTQAEGGNLSANLGTERDSIKGGSYDGNDSALVDLESVQDNFRLQNFRWYFKFKVEDFTRQDLIAFFEVSGLIVRIDSGQKLATTIPNGANLSAINLILNTGQIYDVVLHRSDNGESYAIVDGTRYNFENNQTGKIRESQEESGCH